MFIRLKKDKYILEKEGVYISFTKDQLIELQDLLYIINPITREE